MDEWLSTTGQCAEFGYVLRATAADLVISYGHTAQNEAVQ
jgi:hypothetical protein